MIKFDSGKWFRVRDFKLRSGFPVMKSEVLLERSSSKSAMLILTVGSDMSNSRLRGADLRKECIHSL